MKTLNKLIFTELRGRTVSVLASGNRVLQIGTAPDREDCALGTICVGRVRNIVKNINAAFVEYRPGINGYYSLAENRFHLFADGRDGSSPLKNGDEILVQISRAAVKTKDAVLTSKLSLTGQYGVLTLDGSGLGISSKIRDAGWKEQMKEWWEEEARGLVSGLSGTGTSACWLYPADQCVRRSPGGGRTGAVRPGRTDGQASGEREVPHGRKHPLSAGKLFCPQRHGCPEG